VRILITNTGPWGTGSGTVADGIMKELKRRGHKVMAFFPDSGFPCVDYHKYYGDTKSYHIVKFPATYKGTDLYTFPLIISDPNPRNYQNAWTFKELSQDELDAYMGYMRQELERVIDEFAPDVIECQHIWALDHLIHKMDYHYACVAHHSDQLGFLYDERMREVATQSAAKADFIFAISEFVKKEVLELYDVQHKKVIVTENGFDQSLFRPIPNLDREVVLAEMGLPCLEDYPLITFCGKISHTKGVDVLLEANKLIQAQKKAYIMLMGSGSLDNFSLRERRKFHMENVIVVGQKSQSQLALLHNISRLSVLPSRSEGFGIASLEAMGCKKPVVVTDVGGLPSFAVGRIIKNEDPRGLAEAILDILNMEEKEYQNICAQAYATAKRYSWQNIVDIRMKYYRRIALSNGGCDYGAVYGQGFSHMPLDVSL